MSEKEGGKPRVLLSIFKHAAFDADVETLCTAICAGYGRFECEKLMKPSGVELLNLPPSSHIDLTVMRKSSRESILQTVVPISIVMQGSVDNAPPREPQAWEGWLGLFNFGSTKGQSVEFVFRQAADLGSSNSRVPKLYIRLQYLPPGVPQSRPLASAPTAHSSGVYNINAGAPPTSHRPGSQQQTQQQQQQQHQHQQPQSHQQMQQSHLTARNSELPQTAPQPPSPAPMLAASALHGMQRRTFGFTTPLPGGGPQLSCSPPPSVGQVAFPHDPAQSPRAGGRRAASPPHVHGSTPGGYAGNAACPTSVDPMLLAARAFQSGYRVQSPPQRGPDSVARTGSATPADKRLESKQSDTSPSWPFDQHADCRAAASPLAQRSDTASRRPSEDLSGLTAAAANVAFAARTMAMPPRAPPPNVPEKAEHSSVAASGARSTSKQSSDQEICDWKQKFEELSAELGQKEVGWANEKTELKRALEQKEKALAQQRSEMDLALEQKDESFAQQAVELQDALARASSIDIDAQRRSQESAANLRAMKDALDKASAELREHASRQADLERELGQSQERASQRDTVARENEELRTQLANNLVASAIGVGVTYRPDKEDPVDCMLAAHFLRLGVEGARFAGQFVRLSPGVYRVNGKQRVTCRLDHHGRLLLRRTSRVAVALSSPVSLAHAHRDMLLSALVPARKTVGDESVEHVGERGEPVRPHDAEDGEGEECDVRSFLEEIKVPSAQSLDDTTNNVPRPPGYRQAR